jgi:hypothetical protein
MQKFLINILEENEGKMNPGSGKAEHILPSLRAEGQIKCE